MSYNTTIIEKIFRGHTMAVFANPPLPPLNGPLWSPDKRKEESNSGKDEKDHFFPL